MVSRPPPVLNLKSNTNSYSPSAKWNGTQLFQPNKKYAKQTVTEKKNKNNTINPGGGANMCKYYFQ
jgi:hypothetical protein